MTVIIPSHVILDTVSKDTPIKTVYSIVDDIISHGVTSLIHLIVDKTKDSSIRIWNSTNLNNLENWFQNSNCFGSMGIGKGEGPNAAVDAVLSAIAYPTFGEIHFQVKSILCTIQGGPNMTQKDVRACEENLYQCFGPAIQVFISAYKDENLKEDAVTVVIIALNH
jgi:cell division GTPase FtsZ